MNEYKYFSCTYKTADAGRLLICGAGNSGHPGKMSSEATLYPAESTERFGGPSVSFMAFG